MARIRKEMERVNENESEEKEKENGKRGRELKKGRSCVESLGVLL